MARFAVITTRPKPTLSRSWWLTPHIFCASNRSRSPNRFRTRCRAFVANHSQIIAVIAIRQLIDRFCEAGAGNKFHPQRDFFQTRDFESLSMFDRRDIIAGLEQTGLRSSVDPGHAAAEQLHVQFVFLDVLA